MRVAVFTDNDFDKINGVTTALSAVLRYAPPDVSPRIYTSSPLGVDQPDYFSIASTGMPIPVLRRNADLLAGVAPFRRSGPV